MKKSLAILMSAILLFSSLACGVVLTASAWVDVETLKSDLFLDFTTKAGYDAFLAGTAGKANDGFFNMTHSYDTDGVKMVLDAGKNSCEVRLGCHGGYRISATDAPVLAMKVRIPSESVFYHGTQWGNGPYFRNCHTGSVAKEFNTGNKYDLTTANWQLVVLDLSEVAGDRTRIHLNLNMLGKSGVSPTIYMQWAGYFKSAADAQTFYNGYTGPAISGGNDDVSGLPSDLLLNFATKAGYDEFLASTTTNTTDGIFNITHSYDTDSVKMVLPASNGAEIRVGCNGGYNVSSTEYPVFAMKVKIPGDSVFYHSAQWGNGPYLWTFNAGPASKDYSDSTKSYFGNKYDLTTSDWQLVMLDMSDVAGTGVNWTRIQLRLNMLGKANTTPTMYMQWAGYFKSAAEATWYFNGDIPDDPTPITNKSSRQTNDDGNALRFGFDVATGNYSGISYAAGDYAAAQASGNYDRKLDNAKMNLGGTMTNIVGFGALISKSNLADNAFVVGAAGVKQVEADNLYGLTANRLTYTVRVTNIPEANKGTTIYARSYVAYMDAGSVVYVYGDIVSDSVNGAIAE